MHHPPQAFRIGIALFAVLCAGATARAAGVVGTGTPASCTEAALNAALAGFGTVTFNCGGPGQVTTIPITSTKVLTATTTIDGSGQAIILDGGSATRLFRTTYQFTQFTITFRNLTLRSGRAPDYGAALRLDFQEPSRLTVVNVEGVTFSNNVCDQSGNDIGGGAIYAQSGILTIRNSAFLGNRGGNGGAIGNLQARFTIEDTLFSGNSTNPRVNNTGGNGGAIYIDGSGGGQLVVRRSTFLGNSAAWIGGAFHTYLYAGGTGMTIEDSTFASNSTYANGGAIYHQNGTLQIARSTFSGNTTRGQGGAIWLLEGSTVGITNSTFTGNSATGIAPNNGSSGLGGAILINANNNVTISHTTIANNHADWVGGGITGGVSPNSTTTLRGSIVANNTAANGGNPWNIGQNCSTQLVEGGGNLQFPARNPNDGSDRNCTGTIAIGEPLLAALANNGGLTATRALGLGSPARNRVTTGCPPPATDQRGVARPAGACDAGAYEAAAFVSAAGLSVPEGSAGSVNAVFNLTLSETSAQPVTVTVQTVDGTATAGSDYTATSGTVTFPPGATTATRSVPITPDVIDEFDETFTLALSNPVNAALALQPNGIATIVDDDDPPTLTAGDCIALEGTGAGGTCAVSVALSTLTGKPVTLAYTTVDGSAFTPADYAARSGFLTLPPGTSSAVVAVPFVGDGQDETDETFSVIVSSVQNATVVDDVGVVTIDDDDGPVLAAGPIQVVEGNSGTTNASFAFTLSAPTVQDVVVGYGTAGGTAMPGVDFQGTNGAITFPAGTTARTVDVAVTGDTQDEPNETFYLSLDFVSDATPPAGHLRATILDDDGADFVLTALDHGADRRETLAGGLDLFVLHQPPLTSWEVRVEGASGDLGNGTGPLLERVAGDQSLVIQSSTALGTGPARTLRWRTPPFAPHDDYIRVSSPLCGGGCGPDDVYRLRAYDTTARIARFNASGGQTTVVFLQNTTTAPVAFQAYFWSPSGSLLGIRSATVPARALHVFNAADVIGIPGQSGAVSIAHDGGYGGLVGKAVSLQPATGFSFDTPLTYRPR